MWIRRLAIGIAALAVLVAVGLVSYRAWPRRAPPGQRALETLSALDRIRTAFNEARGEYRVVALFSPTCAVCVDGAAGLGQLLQGTAPSSPVRAFIVWMPVIGTDIAAPTSAKLALISD